MNQRFPNRHTYIGASEIGAAIGVSEWDTPYEMWQYKTLRLVKPPQNGPMERGQDMEPVAIALAERRYGMTIAERQKEVQTVDGRIRAHLDGIIPQYEALPDTPGIDAEGPGLAEVKCPGYNRAGKIIRTGPDLEMICQVQVGMHLAKLTWARLIVLDYDDYRLVCTDLLYEPELAKRIIDQGYAFLDLVDRDTAPPQDAQPTFQMPASAGAPLTAEGELAEILARAVAAKADLDNANQVWEFASDQVREAMKDHTQMVAPGIGQAVYPVVRGRRSIQGDKLLSWAQELCQAIIDRQEAKFWTMAKRLNGTPDLFVTVGNPSRRLSVKAEGAMFDD